MLQFHHWFWITFLAGLKSGLTFPDVLDREILPNSEKAIVRRVSSFQPLRLGRAEQQIREEEILTERSVSVSKVRVEVGEKKLYNRKKKNLKPRKKPKTLLDSLFTKLKSFAKVTLASRERNENPFPSSSLNRSAVSSVNSKRGNKSEAFNGSAHENSESKLPTNESGDSHDKKNLGGSESHIGGHSYGDKHNLVISDMSAPATSRPGKETSIALKATHNEGIVVIGQNASADTSVSDARSRGRSKEARGRSLWGFGGGSERLVIGESDEKERNSEDESNFSFSNDRTVNESPIAIEKEANIILEQESRIYLLEFSNIVIIVIAVGIFIVIAVVLTLLLLCRSHKPPVKSCEAVSDVSSNSSPVPQKSVISYNCEGTRLKQPCLSDELYSLDSDYFLSSLEDISAQV